MAGVTGPVPRAVPAAAGVHLSLLQQTHWPQCRAGWRAEGVENRGWPGADWDLAGGMGSRDTGRGAEHEPGAGQPVPRLTEAQDTRGREIFSWGDSVQGRQ